MSKKVLAALLAVCMVASLLFVPAAAATFNDVDEDHWAAGAIERWAGYGVLNGKDAEAGIFDPSAPMTRAEFAKMLVEMLGLTAKSDTTFDDVNPDAWYADVVSIAVKAGIISGRPGNKFAPTDPVTFEEAAVMMCRAFGLAQNTSGAEWAKESIEKLTSLGMIGEGADEHLQVGVDCDRAVVAALADAVVKEYVNEDREEPISGEIKGVVLVVKGAKVELKDATVSAPIVVESAEVTLNGTKAEDVKVSGKDAAITADETSTVASVTLAGEAPKADIKGEVASVTIAEETTGAVVDAPKAAEDAIVNNSAEEATVNGETVEGKPAETTDPENPENPDDSTPGSVNGGGSSLPTPVEKNEHTHNWNEGVVTTAATCTKDGVKTFTCVDGEGDVKGCGATKTEVIPMIAHNYGTAEEPSDTCTVCGAAKPATACTDESHAALTADQKREVIIKAATCAEAGKKATYCKICNAKLGDDVEIAKLTTHTPGSAWVVEGGQHGHQCSVCGEVVDLHDHSYGRTYRPASEANKHTATCSVCGFKLTDGACAAAETPAYGHNTTQHWTKCEDCGRDMTPAENHVWTEKTGTCDTCGYACTHDWGDWSEWADVPAAGGVTRAGEAAAKTQQKRTRTCDICGLEQTETRDKPANSGSGSTTEPEEPDTPPVTDKRCADCKTAGCPTTEDCTGKTCSATATGHDGCLVCKGQTVQNPPRK